MRICLAAMSSFSDEIGRWMDCHPQMASSTFFALESFYSMTGKFVPMIRRFPFFILDSGAFSMLSNKANAKGIDWFEYADSYCDFIVKNGIERYVELDIDSIIGTPKVLELRSRIEKRTGRPCIPVWHKQRGIESFYNDVRRYGYVSIGASGKNDSDWTNTNVDVLTYLIRYAHERRVKVHGLGYSRIKNLDKVHFDSVDSTTWIVGHRTSMIFSFDGKTIRRITRPEGCRMKHYKLLLQHNLTEWAKFQKYANERF